MGSSELRRLEGLRNNRLKDLKWIEADMKKEKESLSKINNSVLCPRCKSNMWIIYATYNPFKKYAYEARVLKLVCSKCNYAWKEHGSHDIH